MPRRPRTLGVQGNLWTRIKSWLTDYRTWTTMLYMVLQLPLGIIYFTVIVTGADGVGGDHRAADSCRSCSTSRSSADFEYGYLIQPWAMPLVMAVGVLGFFVTLWIAKGIGFVHGHWAKVDAGWPLRGCGRVRGAGRRSRRGGEGVMSKRTWIAIAVVAVLCAAVFSAGCVRVPLPESQKVFGGEPGQRAAPRRTSAPLGGATRIDATIRMGVGDLTVSSVPSSTAAFTGEFTYNPRELEARGRPTR